MSSLRRFTSQQFSDGTTIDGNRLEKALQDLEDWSSKIKDGDFANRWMQSQFILKYLPPTASSDATLAANSGVAGNYRRAPFLPIYNPTTAENPHRLKGTKLHWQTGYVAPVAGVNQYNEQVVWTSVFTVGEDPLIVSSVDAVFLTYSYEYNTDWKYDSGSPGGAVGEYSNDIHLQITADNPFLPNLQLKNTIVFHKYLSSADGSLFCDQAISLATIDDMNPSLTSVPGMVPMHETSLSMNLDDLNIPIPPYTRLRFSLVLPVSAGPLWGIQPWGRSIPTLSLTVLERIADG